VIRVYRHRVNDVEALRTTGEPGIELDLRSDGQRVIVTHDPFTDGPRLEEYLPHVGSRACIFNIKCEGIEEYVVAAAKAHGIEDFFLLDCSIPAMTKLGRRGERRMAVRWSEYEPLEFVRAWRGVADWVWVDCFTRFPGTAEHWSALALDHRLCLVSPELQGHDISRHEELVGSIRGREFHAVCTKLPAAWSTP